MMNGTPWTRRLWDHIKCTTYCIINWWRNDGDNKDCFTLGHYLLLTQRGGLNKIHPKLTSEDRQPTFVISVHPPRIRWFCGRNRILSPPPRPCKLATQGNDNAFRSYVRLSLNWAVGESQFNPLRTSKHAGNYLIREQQRPSYCTKEEHIASTHVVSFLIVWNERTHSVVYGFASHPKDRWVGKDFNDVIVVIVVKVLHSRLHSRNWRISLDEIDQQGGYYNCM
jgi:hypothetical protein